MNWGDVPTWLGALGPLGIIGAVTAILSARRAGRSAAATEDQARSARESAAIAKSALEQAQKQSEAATRSARAAEAQAEEANKQVVLMAQQNAITQRQLDVTIQQFESDTQRRKAAAAARNVGDVHTAFLAAKDAADELRDHFALAVERNGRPRPVGPFIFDAAPLFLPSSAMSRWENCLDTLLYDRPPDEKLLSAFAAHAKLVKLVSEAVDQARGRAEDWQLTDTEQTDLHRAFDRIEGSYAELSQRCDAFFEAQGINPEILPPS